MDDLRSRLMSIAVTLIVTGIIGKLVPEKSNKSIINFVITMVIIANAFGFDLSSFEDFTEFEISTESYQQEVLESEINNRISQMLSNEIEAETEKIVQKYDSDATVNIAFEEQVLQIKITSNSLSDYDKSEIEDEIKAKFEGEILFKYTVVD